MTEKAPVDTLVTLIDIALRHAIPSYESLERHWDLTWPLPESTEDYMTPMEVLMLAIWKTAHEHAGPPTNSSRYRDFLERFKNGRPLKETTATLALLLVDAKDHPILDIQTLRKSGESRYLITDLPKEASRTKDYRDDPELKQYAERVRTLYRTLLNGHKFRAAVLDEYRVFNHA